MKKFFVAMAAAAVLFSVTAKAADLAVLPVRLNLSTSHDRDAITITNRGLENVVMQVETVSWTQVDSHDQYAPTKDVLINPPLFTVLPGQSQVLRIGLRKPPTGSREVAYRVLLREVPPPAGNASADPSAGLANVRLLLQMRLPVYVAPAKIVQKQQWQGRRSADGSLAVALTNMGNVHLVVNELRLHASDAAADAPPLALLRTNAAVFSGQSQSWQFRGGEKAIRGQNFKLEVVTDQGPHYVALDLERQ